MNQIADPLREMLDRLTEQPLVDRAKYLSYLEKRQSIKRHISPEDIDHHVLFYLSEASAASTGHNCVVDGGWLLE